MPKPRILLVPDRPGWAFDFLADELMHFAGERYDFTKVPKSEFDPARHGRGFDAAYFFWWGQGSRELIRAARIPARRAMTVVSSFNSWAKKGWGPDELAVALEPWSAVGAISAELGELLAGRHPRVFLTRHGIDPQRFFEREPIPARREGDELVVGWAGSLKYAELKGLPNLIEPAVARVPGVRLVVAAEGHSHGRPFERDEMIDFYHAIDAYVCASREEGAPLTLIEAGACGRTVITTRVGIVDELVVSGESGLVVDRTVDALASALEKLKNDRERLIDMGAALRAEVTKSWTWHTRVKEYEAMFDAVIERGRTRRWRLVNALVRSRDKA
ncbi:MAG: glycosyltransferase family 4 protein [bacterium]|nr:glycosyltransferase family 4 protein [bacterium]